MSLQASTRSRPGVFYTSVHLVAGLLLAPAIWGCSCDWNRVPLRTEADADVLPPARCEPAIDGPLAPVNLIAHAGGGYQGKIYTNSFEAMNASYENGFRLFEIDLRETYDGNVVGVHDWKEWFREYGSLPGGRLPTTSEFFAANKSGLTLVDYSKVQEWISEKDDAVLVTDKIRDLDYLVEYTPDPNKLIIEVFSFEDYVGALRRGLARPMLSIHEKARLGSSSDVLAFVDSWDVQYAATSLAVLETRWDLVESLLERGVCIYAFTSNSKSEIESYHAKGIHGFYTDFYVPEHW